MGSVIVGIFSRVLERRLRNACPLHPRQRGFIPPRGCSENLMLLDAAMKISRRGRKKLGVVFIDFAKAFDTVSHHHLRAVLEERGVDDHFTNVVFAGYDGCVTRVRCGSGTTLDIPMKVGVKQGDSLSPLLFNLAIDPLINTIEREGRGVSFGNYYIAAMAFADDLVLLSDSARNLIILQTFCQLTGMRCNPAKCHGFFIGKTTGRTTYNAGITWMLDGGCAST